MSDETLLSLMKCNTMLTPSGLGNCSIVMYITMNLNEPFVKKKIYLSHLLQGICQNA